MSVTHSKGRFGVSEGEVVAAVKSRWADTLDEALSSDLQVRDTFPVSLPADEYEIVERGDEFSLVAPSPHGTPSDKHRYIVLNSEVDYR